MEASAGKGPAEPKEKELVKVTASLIETAFPTTKVRVTENFVEFYLAEAGFNPADFNTNYLARIWREAVERGVIFNAGQHITYDSVNSSDDEVFCQAMNTFDWPEPRDVYEKFKL